MAPRRRSRSPPGLGAQGEVDRGTRAVSRERYGPSICRKEAYFAAEIVELWSRSRVFAARDAAKGSLYSAARRPNTAAWKTRLPRAAASTVVTRGAKAKPSRGLPAAPGRVTSVKSSGGS